MIENLDDVKQALNVESLRNIGGEKVMELVGLMQSGQLTEAGQIAVFTAAPELLAKVSDAMDDANEQAVHSNDQSSASVYEHLKQSKDFWAARAVDPEATEEERRDARDRFERVDERLMNHDVNNKQFNLELIKNKKDVLLAVAGFAVLVIGGLAGGGKLPLPRR
ncbi:hypothetical protein [Corynebacterium stationis]|uniref:hypothetical protein n=1 Tax=Corynebacterium stationis TaxID=1705 RepID=UPI0028AE35FE|nr:hypothetical protein [Corynebacterium stationis]